MNHTLGPWQNISDTGRSPPPQMALVATPGGKAAIDCTGSGKTFAEDRANAHLIAAAPDMLSALRMVWNSIDRVNHPAANAVLAAIKKAGGE
jgi:hypothetical protein